MARVVASLLLAALLARGAAAAFVQQQLLSTRPGGYGTVAVMGTTVFVSMVLPGTHTPTVAVYDCAAAPPAGMCTLSGTLPSPEGLPEYGVLMIAASNILLVGYVDLISLYLFSCAGTACTPLSVVSPYEFITNTANFTVSEFNQVAFSGALLAVSSSSATVNGVSYQGVVYVFDCSNSTACSLLDIVTAGDGQGFGLAVAASGSLVAVSTDGGLFVFNCPAPLLCTLLFSTNTTFGSLAMSGSLLAVISDSAASIDQLVVTMFSCTNTSSTCVQGVGLTPLGLHFPAVASGVVLYGSTLIVNAYTSNYWVLGPAAAPTPEISYYPWSSAYVYSCASEWNCAFVGQLNPASGNINDMFAINPEYGSTIAASASIIAVGAPGTLVDGVTVGATYVFTCANAALGLNCTGCSACASGLCDAALFVCECSAGWALSANATCTECESGYYGPTCAACACSAQQTCSDGRAGTGACTCLRGWEQTGPHTCAQASGGLELVALANPAVNMSYGSFGDTVIVAGTLAFVGSSLENVNGVWYQGAVYVYDCAAGVLSCTQVAKVVPDELADFAYFGGALAVSGQLLVVGADGGGDQNQGQAFVFSCASFANCQQGAVLVGPEQDYAHFGAAVAAWGSIVAVGAPNFNNSLGIVYLFACETAASCVPALVLTPTNVTLGFGAALAATSTWLAVGAPYSEVDGSVEGGLVSVFVCASAYKCDLVSELQAFNLSFIFPLSDLRFGGVLAASESLLVVGALGFDNDVVFVFDCSATGECEPIVALEPSPTIDYMAFGGAIAAYGSTVLASAALLSVGQNYFQGAVYVYSCSALGCDLEARLTSGPIGQFGDAFGLALGISQSVIAVGAPGHDTFQGSLFVFGCVDNTAGLDCAPFTCVHGTALSTSPFGGQPCACAPQWAGALCDTCAEGFADTNCSSCAAGYFGANCTSCALCKHGVCTTGIGGSCACNPGWLGPLCTAPNVTTTTRSHDTTTHGYTTTSNKHATTSHAPSTTSHAPTTISAHTHATASTRATPTSTPTQTSTPTPTAAFTPPPPMTATLIGNFSDAKGGSNYALGDSIAITDPFVIAVAPYISSATNVGELFVLKCTVHCVLQLSFWSPDDYGSGFGAGNGALALGANGLLVVGAYGATHASDGSGYPDNGAAYVYSCASDFSECTQTDRLSPLTSEGGFGWAVTATGTLLAIAANGDGVNDQGQVYVYACPSPSSCTQQQILTDLTLADGSDFGASVASTSLAATSVILAVGVPNYSSKGHSTGGVYVYNCATPDGGNTFNCTLQTLLNSVWQPYNYFFGRTVSLSPSGVLVAGSATGEANYDPSVYLFLCNATGACQNASRVFDPQYSYDANLASFSDFGGTSTAISPAGTFLLVGAPNEGADSEDFGAAYGYQCLWPGYNCSSSIVFSNPITGFLADDCKFGYRVAVSDNLIAIAVPNYNYGQGLVFVYAYTQPSALPPTSPPPVQGGSTPTPTAGATSSSNSGSSTPTPTAGATSGSNSGSASSGSHGSTGSTHSGTGSSHGTSGSQSTSAAPSGHGSSSATNQSTGVSPAILAGAIVGAVVGAAILAGALVAIYRFGGFAHARTDKELELQAR